MNTKPEKGMDIKMKVQELIDNVIEKCGLNRLDRTCDQLIEGDPEMEITGIVTTFMATVDVIKKAHELGANLIVTHEPTYLPAMTTGSGRSRIPFIWKKKTDIGLRNRNLADARLHPHGSGRGWNLPGTHPGTGMGKLSHPQNVFKRAENSQRVGFLL